MLKRCGGSRGIRRVIPVIDSSDSEASQSVDTSPDDEWYLETFPKRTPRWAWNVAGLIKAAIKAKQQDT